MSSEEAASPAKRQRVDTDDHVRFALSSGSPRFSIHRSALEAFPGSLLNRLGSSTELGVERSEDGAILLGLEFSPDILQQVLTEYEWESQHRDTANWDYTRETIGPPLLVASHPLEVQ